MGGKGEGEGEEEGGEEEGGRVLGGHVGACEMQAEHAGSPGCAKGVGAARGWAGGPRGELLSGCGAVASVAHGGAAAREGGNIC